MQELTVYEPVERLASEDVVLAAPLSYTGSAQRIWSVTRISDRTEIVVPLVAAAILGTVGIWLLVTAWYLIFGVFLVPYRIVRRGQRKRRLEELRHREQLAAIQALNSSNR
jgi:hypothetical protein